MPVTTMAQDKQQADYGDEYSTLLSRLTVKSYKEKEKTVKDLAALEDEKVLNVMQLMLDGDLYYTKADKRIVHMIEQDNSYLLTDMISGLRSEAADDSGIKKIKTNNRLRKVLRGEISRISLADKDAGVRLKAALDLVENVDADVADLFRQTLDKERNDEVIEVIETGLALYQLNDEDKKTRLKSIDYLSGSLYPTAKVLLRAIVAKDDNGQYAEKDADIRKAATSSLSAINAKIKINETAENIFFGLSLGSVLLLAAIGLAITFGVMGVINMAHGELMMLGAYTTYMIQTLLPDYLEYSLIMAVPAAFVVSGLFGIAIERGVIRYLYGRPLETLLATFGISLILQQLVRTTISAQNVIVSTPSWMSGSWQINPLLSVTYNRLYIIIFSLIVFAALVYVLKKTVLGLQVRAVSQNRAMAKAMGIRSDWVDALTFGLGSGIAGIAGVALSQLTNVGPNLGQAYIIDSFMVVVFGGVGNLWGTLVGAMSLGVINKFLEPWAGAVLAKILVLVFIILFIQKRPRGLFPKKGRGAEG